MRRKPRTYASPEALADTIVSVMKNDAKRAAIGRTARHAVLQRFYAAYRADRMMAVGSGSKAGVTPGGTDPSRLKALLTLGSNL
jgi:hypothetical protein